MKKFFEVDLPISVCISLPFKQNKGKVIKNLHSYVDHWKVGKINHNREIEDGVDWMAAREEIENLLVRLGANYRFKKSLGG